MWFAACLIISGCLYVVEMFKLRRLYCAQVKITGQRFKYFVTLYNVLLGSIKVVLITILFLVYTGLVIGFGTLAFVVVIIPCYIAMIIILIRIKA